MDIRESLGLKEDGGRVAVSQDRALIEYIQLRLLAMGQPVEKDGDDPHSVSRIAAPLFANAGEIRRHLAHYRSPVDRRITDFLDRFLAEIPPEDKHEWIPLQSFETDRYGIARVLALPFNGDEFHSDYIDSYRVAQGILHNPREDKRTTKDVFHIVEGGPVVPDDKIAVPKIAFARLLRAACHPPQTLLEFPFTAHQKRKAHGFVSSYLRPVVCPEVPGFCRGKRMEIRFFAPASLVHFIDCVESIFGTAGSPSLPENNAALEPETWTGHSGCILIAPHLTQLRKKELGLPHISEASERQKRDGMCWADEQERYHDGRPFKLMARTLEGVIVSLIADSYNGYGKKEIKTQLSYSANLYGQCEEEHSGGTLAFAAYDLGDEFCLKKIEETSHTLADVLKTQADSVMPQAEGYAIDRRYPDIFYVPEDANFTLQPLEVCWKQGGQEQSLPLEPDKSYLLPSGYRVELLAPTAGSDECWRLIGTRGDCVFCHKPSTVSGGGKSEMASPLTGNISRGTVLSEDLEEDFRQLQGILRHDLSHRYRRPEKEERPILDSRRSLGSVIKIFHPQPDYTEEHKRWVASIPPHIKDLLFVLKAYYKPAWGEDWPRHFSVDWINGHSGHALKYLGNRLVARYLRVGFTDQHTGRLFTLRQDFYPACKWQMEDDITASILVPAGRLAGFNAEGHPSLKCVSNGEYRLYQRPDEAIIPGNDPKAELLMTLPETFCCNLHPITKTEARGMLADRIAFSRYSEAMQRFLKNFAERSDGPRFAACPSVRRHMPNGSLSTNPRYLEDREDLTQPRKAYLLEQATRLARRLPEDRPVSYAVQAIISGRRNNPPEENIPPLSVHNPLHYLELPELFMEYASNATGKSPSTTGSGLEGAMTKRPFNGLSTVTDLNNALTSFLLSGYQGFISSASYLGPRYAIGHDISYLIPELWCRLSAQERDANFLIAHGYLEPCRDFQHRGQCVEASRLGYRITDSFVKTFLGRIVSSPETLFCDEMLRPELQDLDLFARSMANIVDAQRRAAEIFFHDGSIEGACPPLRALLEIMAYGEANGLRRSAPEFRQMFEPQALRSQDWYQQRLEAFRHQQIQHWERCRREMQALRASTGAAPDGHGFSIPSPGANRTAEPSSFPLQISASPAASGSSARHSGAGTSGIAASAVPHSPGDQSSRSAFPSSASQGKDSLPRNPVPNFSSPFPVDPLRLDERIAHAEQQLATLHSQAFFSSLQGCLGLDPYVAA
ncbi:MAG: hypothetical protein LBT57_00280 [Puniceicoccales bacterium]|jgi:hypothetical protein|nr:hypothetical protein [Puniceicoccales bacterium]